jgi:hypothetical protein
MIVEQKENTIQSCGVKLTKEMGISQDGMGFIQNILRSQIYSCKVSAVIRELVVNGVDSHIEAGCPTRPVEVTLPSRFDSTLKVRDFGTGMSEETVLNLYAYFGSSSKRNTNAQSGFMGIGKVSPLSYGDSFILTSFLDGKKNTYNIYVDSNNLSQIAKLSSGETTESNGVEVSVAVKDCDILSFHDKAYQLFRYFKVRPIVHGAKFEYTSDTPIIKGTDWAIFGKSQTSIAIMGNIGYPIADHFQDPHLSDVLSCGLEIQFEIGEVSVSASRESLEYNPSTKRVIKDKLTRIAQEVSSELNTRFKSCATLFDAHKMYGTIMNYGSNLYALRNMVKGNLTFGGKPITDSRIDYKEAIGQSYVIREFQKHYRGNKIKSYNCYYINCSDSTVLIENDLAISNGITNRIYNLVMSGKKVYLLSYNSPTARQTFMDGSGLVDANFIKLSSLPKIFLSTASGNVVKNTKHSSKEFVYDLTYAEKNDWTRKLSNYWTQEVVDVDNDAGIYLIIDAFKYRTKNGGLSDPDELKNIVNSMKTFGIALPKIYGFKMAKRDAVKKNKNMVSLWDYIADELTKYFAANKVAQKVANRLEFDANAGSNWMEFLLKNGDKANKKTALFKIAELVNYMKSKADEKILDAAMNWKEYFNATEKPEHKMEKLIAEINSTYPLFSSIDHWHSMIIKGKARDALIQYVNLIDG